MRARLKAGVADVRRAGHPGQGSAALGVGEGDERGQDGHRGRPGEDPADRDESTATGQPGRAGPAPGDQQRHPVRGEDQQPEKVEQAAQAATMAA